MALRFRKAFKVAPGVRMNLSTSGASWSLGPRGAIIGVGKRGTTLNMGIPGTGIYHRQTINNRKTSSVNAHESARHTNISICIEILDDGTTVFKDDEGNELPESLIRLAKRQNSDAIRNLMKRKCEAINQEIESVTQIHIATPSPFEKPFYSKKEFQEPRPEPPTLKKPDLIQSLFKNQRRKIEVQNLAVIADYQEQLRKWELDEEEFTTQENQRKQLIEELIYLDPAAMSDYLENRLKEICWPRETIVSTEIISDGKAIFVDVDLPEIEDMPRKRATVPATGYNLSVKDLPVKTIQNLYVQHIHGIAFRIIGEVFASLPKAEEVIFSGFSQRPEKSTGRISEDYLLSVRVRRVSWEEIAFNHLNLIDVVDSLTRFELKRCMTKAGLFSPIEPFSPEDL